tara:strand:- start:253 stop:456 length:204 start_codon:yes stop_codon:yes gene_type:complete
VNKKAYAFFIKENRKNPIAKSLKNNRYNQTIINSKKIYSRKGGKNEIIKELQSSGTHEEPNSHENGS